MKLCAAMARSARPLIALVLCGLADAGVAQPLPPSGAISAPKGNPGVKCLEDSPERRGEEGCTVFANRRLTGSTARPLYWHLDQFDTLEAARKAASPDAVAAAAHGAVWLMTVEGRTEDHHGGRHVALIGPLSVQGGAGVAMRMQSSLLRPGSAAPAHVHPGPEVIYVVEGEQCTQTPNGSKLLRAGQFAVVPGDMVHRPLVTGSTQRRVLALNLYDAAQPASRDLPVAPELPTCR